MVFSIRLTKATLEISLASGSGNASPNFPKSVCNSVNSTIFEAASGIALISACLCSSLATTIISEFFTKSAVTCCERKSFIISASTPLPIRSCSSSNERGSPSNPTSLVAIPAD